MHEKVCLQICKLVLSILIHDQVIIKYLRMYDYIIKYYAYLGLLITMNMQCYKYVYNAL